MTHLAHSWFQSIPQHRNSNTRSVVELGMFLHSYTEQDCKGHLLQTRRKIITLHME